MKNKPFEVNITDQEGTIIETLSIPRNADQVKLSQFIDITASMEEHKEFYDSLSDTPTKQEQLQTLIYHAQEVAAFCDSDNIFGEHILRAGNELNVELTLEVTSQLRNAIWAAISTYKPEFTELHTFTHNNEKYTCKRRWANIVTQQIEYDQLTTLEGIEALEVLRILDTKEGKDDPTGGKRQMSYKRLLAILCRKEGEQLPTNKSKLERFLAQRIVEFKDISYPTAMNVYFWLISYHNDLKKKAI